MIRSTASIRRIKFWWHLLVAYIRRYQLRIAVTFLTLLLTSYLLYILGPNIIRNNTVTIGYIGNYKIENLPTEALSLVTQPLVTIDESGKSHASLAASWTVSDDGKNYIVYLRDNLFWHDGSPVEAKDISLAITGVEVSALNNKAIQFTLPNPISSFTQALNTPVFKINSFYGTGSYRIVDINQIDSSVKKIVLHPKDKKMPNVEIKFYQNEDQAINAFKIGEIKILKSNNLDQFTSWKNVNVTKKTETGEIVTIFFNNEYDLLQSREARQALSHAINRESITEDQASGPISASSWAFNDSVKKYDYNTSRAKELLSDAEVKNPKITLSYSAGLLKLAEKIKTDWEAVGVTVDLKEEKSIPGEFHAFLATSKLPKDPDQYALWHSTQTNSNITKYKNVKIDKLLEDGRIAKGEEDRRPFYMDFQKFLVEDAPAIFLYYPNKYTVTYKNIEKLEEKLPN